MKESVKQQLIEWAEKYNDPVYFQEDLMLKEELMLFLPVFMIRKMPLHMKIAWSVHMLLV